MKSRRFIPLAVTLVALLLLVAVVVPKEMVKPAQAVGISYYYSVKFVCGEPASDKAGVKVANYATSVNIHNPQSYTVFAQWKVLKLFPTPKQLTAYSDLTFNSDMGLDLRSLNILKRLGMSFPPATFVTGFLVIRSSAPLDVFAVYTMETADESGCSIDIERIPASDIVP
jgi:hypothetical protein